MAEIEPEERVLSESSGTDGERGPVPPAGAESASWRKPPRAEPRQDPHSARELGAALVHPFGALELVLAEQARVARDILSGGNLPRLIGVLLGVSVLFAVPYGLVLGPAQAWRVAALFLGSVAICLPSLHVFSNFLGVRTNVQRNAALTLLVTAVAAAFSFGFFPILWFLSATMADGASVSLAGLSFVFLSLALFAGIAQLLRCMSVMAQLGGNRDSLALMVLWLLLLLFVTYRMADALGLLA